MVTRFLGSANFFNLMTDYWLTCIPHDEDLFSAKILYSSWVNESKSEKYSPPIFTCEQCCSNKTDLSIFLPLLMTAHSRDQRGHRYLNILFLIMLLKNTNKLPHSFHQPFQWNLLLKGMLDYEMRQFGAISKIFISKFMFSSYVWY